MHFFWLASWPSRTAASNTFPPDQPPYHPQHQLFLVPCSEHPPIATAHPLESWDHETTAKPDTNNIPPHNGHQAARSKCGHDVGIVFSALLSCAFSSRLTVRFFSALDNFFGLHKQRMRPRRRITPIILPHTARTILYVLSW